MLGGELVPYSATNFNDRSPYIIKDENIAIEAQQKETNKTILQKASEKSNSKRKIAISEKLSVINSATVRSSLPNKSNSNNRNIQPPAQTINRTNPTITTNCNTKQYTTKSNRTPVSVEPATTTTSTAVTLKYNNNGCAETKVYDIRRQNFNLDHDSNRMIRNSATSINLQKTKIQALRSRYKKSSSVDDAGCSIVEYNCSRIEQKNNVSNDNISTMVSTNYPLPSRQAALPNNSQQQQQQHQLAYSTGGGSSAIVNGAATTNLSSNYISNSILMSSSVLPALLNTSENQDNKNCNNNNNNNTLINNCANNKASSSINNNSNSGNNNNSDAYGRSAALERAYVHDVYENCEEPTGPIRPRVAQFLAGLEPGSIVCDVGCGNGRYLTACNPYICTIGVDRCYRLAKVAKAKGGEVALCDNLDLPFRDESFDAVLSLAVVHHFATTERRVGAIRELARILRIGGRVIISVWALEQRHRRFESQDVLIPWQPPKNRTVNYSDEEDEDEFLPPYHAYTEDSTNSSRSAGDGDSSSLSSSSPGESCYSFVRRAIQKLAGSRKKHPWFLDSWTSKETKNDSSLDYEDAKDLPIELRRLEDFEDFVDPPLSAGLKSRSLGSILNPPPRQIVRSRSSVPSLGGVASQQFVFPDQKEQMLAFNNIHSSSITSSQPHLLGINGGANNGTNASGNGGDCNTKNVQKQNSISPTKSLTGSNHSGNNTHSSNIGGYSSTTGTPTMNRRPKLIKQKQSLCDEDFQLPDNPFHMLNSNLNGSTSNLLNNSNMNSSNTISGSGSGHMNIQTKLFQKQFSDSRLLLRKQSSLNEELMAENRLREKERVRKRIQKQMSLNEAFLCRSVFSKRLQVIREGFTTKLKTSTGSLERVTKNGLVKIMKNFQSAGQFASATSSANGASSAENKTNATANAASTPSRTKYVSMSRKNSCQNSLISGKLAMQHCIAAGTHTTSSGVCPSCNNGSGGSGSGGSSNSSNSNDDQAGKPRRHSRESGSDSSKDSSLQSDTSIESEDSFASVIFIPKPETQTQHTLQYAKCPHHTGNGPLISCNCNNTRNYSNGNNIIPSVPTSPLIMPCPPTPAHSPAALNSYIYSGNINSNSVITSPPLQLVSGMLLSPPNLNMQANFINNDDEIYNSSYITNNFEKIQGYNRFTFDEAHILAQQQQATATTCDQQHADATKAKTTATNVLVISNVIEEETTVEEAKKEIEKIDNKPSPVSSPTGAVQKRLSPKITRQSIKDLPPIPKFRKNHSLPIVKNSYPIIRRSSASPGIAKLQSLEIFNPATDDLDSDSSEPSSPDSIDSVIDARPTSGLSSGDSGTDNNNKSSSSSLTLTKPETPPSSEATPAPTSNATQRVKLQHTKKYHSLDLPSLTSTSTMAASSLTSLSQGGSNEDEKKTGALPNYVSKFNSINRSNELIKANQELLSKYSSNKDNLLINNLDLKNITSNSFTSLNDTTTTYNKSATTSRQELIDFAEQLSAQLLIRLDADANKKKKLDDSPPQPDGDSGTFSSGYLDEFIDDHPYTSKPSHRHSGNDLAEWREELRERRLNLANLSTQTSQRQSPISSSTSSLSSQTARSYTIHEEDEDIEAADSSTGYSSSTAQLGNFYENRSKSLKYKRNSSSNGSYVDYRNYSIYPETAYLIQDGDGDSLSREDDDLNDDMDNHNIILEEDEEEYDRDEHRHDDEDDVGENGYSKKTTRNTIKCQDSSDSMIEDLGTPETDVRMMDSDELLASNKGIGIPSEANASGSNENGVGAAASGAQESWALTNSSNSLDSPSQSGGSTTHHRYYHVFREGELDALINHHVTSLHIVSSYYERASWCVVAEKVQVWTI